jgi:arabinose-5-phosphate isomerase
MSRLLALEKSDDLIDTLFCQSQAHLGYFFEHLDLDELRAVVNQLLTCQGTIFLTGVGKSGIISQKIAMTMSCYGIRALSLCPTNALHGDIGLVSDKDIVLLLSKSGETEELLHLCPALRNKGASLIAVVSSRNSRLAKACDSSIFLPVAKELCPFDLAPTTSTVVQLLFGDLVATALMRHKSVSVDDFAGNHPAGRIGRRITLRVRDVMLQGAMIPLCSPEAALVDILVELSDKRCGCILAVDSEKRLLGIFTDGDLRRALQKGGSGALSLPVGDLMTSSPRLAHPEMFAYDAMCLMESDQKRAITVLPVVDNGFVVGLIKLHDIVQSGLC